MPTYTLIPATGAPCPVELADSEPSERWRGWNDAIDADVGAPLPVEGDPSYLLWVDGNGKGKDLPLNRAATYMAGSAVVGAALLIPKEDLI